MFDFLTDFFLALTWRKILLGVAIFLVSFFANLGIVTWILVKLPADHFSKRRKTKFWSGPRPWIHALKVIGKNIAGVLLVALGIVLSLPGARARFAYSSSRYYVARLSGKTPVGTEVVK